MPHVAEYSGFQNGAGLPITITVTAAVPAGQFLALGICTSASTGPQLETVADSKGNAWTKAREGQTGTSGGTHLWYCKPTVALAAGDTVTITPPGSAVVKQPAVLNHFDDNISAADTGRFNDNGNATSAAPTSLAFVTTQPTELLIGVYGLVSAGRVFTAAAGWTQGAKIVTTSGSGDRGVQMFWQYVSAAGSYTANGTITGGSALYGMIGQGFVISTPPPGRSGKVWLWDVGSSAWLPHPVLLWDSVSSTWIVHPVAAWDPTANGGLGDWVVSL